MARFNLSLLVVLVALLCASEAVRIKRCPAVDSCLTALKNGKKCPLLPVPRRQLPTAPPPPSGFFLEKIRRGVYTYFDLVYRTLIVYHSRRLVLVDFPDTGITESGEYLLIRAVNQVLSGSMPRRVDMIYSHRHTDHIGRAGLMKDYVEKTFPGVKVFVWGTMEVVKSLSRGNAPTVPVPNKIIGKSGRELDIAPGLKLKLSILGGHTFQDLISFIPPSRNGKGLIHYVDILTPGTAPFLDFSLTVDFARYIEAQREALKLDWEIISAGHGRLGSKFDMRRNIRYTKSVLEAAKMAVTEVPPRKLAEIDRLTGDSTAVQFGNGAWNLVTRIQLATDICVAKVIKQWGCRIAGVDLLAPSHCKEAGFFAAIDTVSVSFL